MLQQSEWFRPQPNAVVKELGVRKGTVLGTEGNICYFVPDDQSFNCREPSVSVRVQSRHDVLEDGRRYSCYIWRFTEINYPEEGCSFKELNHRFHTWPLKNTGDWDE